MDDRERKYECRWCATLGKRVRVWTPQILRAHMAIAHPPEQRVRITARVMDIFEDRYRQTRAA